MVCCRVDAHLYTLSLQDSVITSTVQHWTITFLVYTYEFSIRTAVSKIPVVMRETAGAEDHMEGLTLTTY
jgi:hypothetical protein